MFSGLGLVGPASELGLWLWLGYGWVRLWGQGYA